MNHSNTLNLGYIVESYPTFIVNEMLEMRRQGENITIFNAFRPVPENDLIKDAFRRESIYFPDNYQGVLTANLIFLIQHPIKYFKMALFLLKEKESLRMLILAAFFARIVKNRGIGHLHATFGTRTTTLAYILSRFSGINYSFTTHAYDIFNYNPSLIWKTNNARFMRTISKYNKKYIIDEYPGIDERSIFVNYLGVDLTKFTQAYDKGHDVDVVNIFSVGHLMYQKGHEYLILACKKLVDRRVNFKCYIAGEGPIRKKLEQQIDDLELQGIVILLGQLPHGKILESLESSDIFALACIDMRGRGEHVDGIPVALMESMSMTLPVISTNISGIPELIEDGVSGLLVPEKDAVALADALEKLIKDRELRKLLGSNARKRIEEHFDLATNTRLLAELFRH